MNPPPWLQRVFDFSLTLTGWQEFGLAFLLGSFAVATLSDLRRHSAQAEFVEVWLLFVLVVLCFEAYDAHRGTLPVQYLAVKWGLIVLLSLLSLRPFGLLFRLAPGDVAALAAAASLLSPVLILCFYTAARLLAILFRRVLSRGQRQWPFMPVISATTLLVFALAWLLRGTF